MYFDSKATLLRSDCTIVKSEALPGTSFAVRLHMSAILLTMTSGCGTVLDLDAGLNSGVGPHIYGGVRADADMIGNPYPDAAEFVVLLGVLDFPFSLALDTALLPITLPVSALCPEDDSHEPANADFKSIDKAFARASSMRILSTGIAALRAEDRNPSIKFAASFELKGRQKVRWDVRWEGATADSGIPKTRLLMVSDGKTLQTSFRTGESPETIKKEDLSAEWLQSVLRRVALLGPGTSALFLKKSPERGDWQVKLLKGYINAVSSKMLNYTATFAGGSPESARINLWYSPGNITLFVRNLEYEGGEAKRKISETYQDYQLDIEISDERFQLIEDQEHK